MDHSGRILSGAKESIVYGGQSQQMNAHQSLNHVETPNLRQEALGSKAPLSQATNCNTPLVVISTRPLIEKTRLKKNITADCSKDSSNQKIFEQKDGTNRTQHR